MGNRWYCQNDQSLQQDKEIHYRIGAFNAKFSRRLSLAASLSRAQLANPGLTECQPV